MHFLKIVIILVNFLFMSFLSRGVNPVLTTTTPQSGATNVAMDQEFSFVFNIDITGRTLAYFANSYIRLIEYDGGTILYEINAYSGKFWVLNKNTEGYDELGVDVINISGSTLSINFPFLLSHGKKYKIEIGNRTVYEKNNSDTSTANVFAGLSSYEFTTAPAAPAPTCTFTPTHGGVSLSPTLSMTFNENVTKSGITGKALRVYQEGVIDPVGVFYADDPRVTVSNSVVNISGLSLAAGTRYYVTVDEGFVKSSASGVDFGGIAGNTTWTFTTGTAPQLSALSPTHNATGVLLDANMTATFDVPVRFNLGSESKLISITDPSGSFINYVVANGVSTPAGVSIVGNVLTIDPSSNFEYGTNYQVNIETGALESMGGIPFAGIAAANWSFTTEDAPAPVGTMVTPDAASNSISILTDVVINYDMAIRNTDGTAITDANVKDLIEIYQGEGAGVLMDAIKYTATIAADKKSITIKMLPGSSYSPNTDVRVVINPVENNQGKHNEAQTFGFKTGYYNIWLGTADSDWANFENWKGKTYTSGASVIIEKGSNGAVLNSDLEIQNMIIAAGGKLTINPNVTLTVNNYFRMYSVNGDGASASLVVNGTLSTVPSKTFVYQGSSNTSFGYYLSSPVTDAVKSTLTSNGVIYNYDTQNDQFAALNPGSLLEEGRGYVGFAYAGNYFSFSGLINNDASYTLPCVYTNKNYGWNLAGNPYPCAIDLAVTYNSLGFTDLKPHVYIRDNATQQLYTWNFPAEVGTANGPQIPSMHAFWVQVPAEKSSGSLTMYKADRVHNNKNYHKSASATPVQKPTIKLFAQNGAVKDLSVITFIPGNDDAYDDYDSEKRLAMTSSVTDLYTVKEGKRLVVNSFGEYSGAKEVPVGVYARKAGTYTLGLASLAGFDQEVELKLVDYGTSPATTHDLSSGDYSFTVAGNTYIDHRFVLQVSNKVATGVEQPEANREVTIYAFQSDVVIENKGDAVGQYTIYDLSGRVLTNGEVGAFSKILVPLSVKGVVLGVVKTSKGMVNQKLLIQ